MHKIILLYILIIFIGCTSFSMTLNIDKRNIIFIEIIKTENKEKTVIDDLKKINIFFKNYLLNCYKEPIKFLLEYKVNVIYKNGDIKTFYISKDCIKYEKGTFRMKNNFDEFINNNNF